ncbi:MAG: hypothetical protein PG981_000838 [Wolbachia endosymbiont of Ctenocephalides orientis wCori]|nr:MAG: hypothetical protein PG981_000838 [Wolbachia endosymbiont of Ctenocephalides orientis wCori]
MPKVVKLILCLIIPVTGFIFYIESHYFQADYTEKSTEINFEPFFKTDPSGPDYIPLPPELTHFDRGVLKVCGNWGTHPDKEDLKFCLTAHKIKK